MDTEVSKHQRFAGTAYFDLVSEIISGGLNSTAAMKGSTEEAQFTEKKEIHRRRENHRKKVTSVKAYYT